MIEFDEKKKIFHLKNSYFSYVLGIEDFGVLAHLYYGKPIDSYRGARKYPRIDRSFSPNFPDAENRLFSRDTLPQEFPNYGCGDFRESAIVIEHNDGSVVSDFRYKDYKIINGKPKIPGLPSTYTVEEAEAKTLKIILEDSFSLVQAHLYYSIYKDRSVLNRRVELINKNVAPISIKKLVSMSLDFVGKDFEMIQLNGAWARECVIERSKIFKGIHRLDSKRGTSSHQQNPFFALLGKNTDETQGEVYGFNLVYSGSHEMIIEKDQYNQIRVQQGIQSSQFNWILKENEKFSTPEVVMVYSSDGLGEMSRTFHHLYNERLVRGIYKEKVRPILFNNWEATYFDFNDDKIVLLAEQAKQLGIELFVLDDGWFGKRNNDRTSLGDWYVSQQKFPEGLCETAKRIRKLKMKFGIWFEPEMISEKSDLYRDHPEWVLHIPGRPLSKSRNQYVLDFSRKEVRENIWEQMCQLLDSTPVDYIKWDMNRHLTEVYSVGVSSIHQGEIHHRYVLGLYEFLEKLIARYPNILFESCSGGGGRFDPGMLFYMSQVWTSDNTDAISRLKIQYGTSLVYPISTMGSHVSAAPNHQTSRNTNLQIRENVAMSGNLGYELDLKKLTKEEKKFIEEENHFYIKYRKLIQYGEFYRLKNPFEGNIAAWMFVDKNRKNAVVFYFKILAEPSDPIDILYFDGLDENAEYEIEDIGRYSGSELMYAGLMLNPEVKEDYQSCRFILRKL